MTERIEKLQTKSVKMPSAEEMVQKLTEANILGISPQSDQFLNKFVKNIAATDKVGGGLAMTWSLAMYDTLSGLSTQVQSIMNMYFDRVIDTITPDTEVAQQAKAFMAEAKQAASKKK